MNYFSLNHNAPVASFKQAVIQGLAPDKGLYFPESIQPLDKEFFRNIDTFSEEEIAFEAIKQFALSDIPETDLKQIIKDTLSFDFPLVNIESNISSLELFHGPTMAFKDVGARFMARCLGYFNRHNSSSTVTVLVATSGDTGGAVANGFLNVKGVNVVILYPSGKVSDIQEKQLTTLGANIRALEVNGTFDDCQDMVKNAFLDEDLRSVKLTSANSINIARWLPQMFYFFFAYRALKKQGKEVVFSVPSGNFGNICAGMMAHKLGLPIRHFVAATNINDIIPNYLKSGHYEPRASRSTISNAMDVGNPSNFIRIQQLSGNDLNSLKSIFSSYSFTDEETRTAMKKVYDTCGYICDPHGAVGYLGLKRFLDEHPGYSGVFLETAHPVKFLDTVETTLNTKVNIPEQIQKIMNRDKVSLKIDTYKELKQFLSINPA